MDIFDIKNRLNLNYKGINLGCVDFIKYGAKETPITIFPQLKTYIDEEKNNINHEYFLNSYIVNDCNCFEITYAFYIDYDLDDICTFNNELLSDIYYKIESVFYAFNNKEDIFNITIDLEKFL